jgi:polyhydroxyalkanoate synthase
VPNGRRLLKKLDRKGRDMADAGGGSDTTEAAGPESVLPPLAEMQHWTGVIGQAQQMLMEHMAEAMIAAESSFAKLPMPEAPAMAFGDPVKFADQQSKLMLDGFSLLSGMMTGHLEKNGLADKDRRFNAAQWRETPIFDVIRQAYLIFCDHWLKGVDSLEGLSPRQRDRLKFAARFVADALSPANFPLTNPQVLERIFETRGENLLRGLEHMLADIGRGQLTHTRAAAFEVGRNIAATPGKVVYETPLYQLIHYTPSTANVLATPLLIFPPWINRFYILDLNPRNSFIRWAVEQGLSVFVVSWRSADESIVDVTMDDYVLRGQIDAIDVVRDLLKVDQVHTIGYCVAGTALSMTLAYLAATGDAHKVASATFFTTQVDFADAGDLKIFIDDEQIEIVAALSKEKGILDGRYMAMTFNLLRGRDLIWNYVVQNYLLGEDYPEFDLLFWNGDTTNLPAKWHRAYLEDMYRDNLLVEPGRLSIGGVPVDLTKIRTASYIQAGREDHIAPLHSVWKLTRYLSGPMRFVLAGSGHIAGVVNPPAASKYQYWTGDASADTVEQFIEGATETRGSWWPDWRAWIGEQSDKAVPAKAARIPGRGRYKAIEDAPGRYVRMR